MPHVSTPAPASLVSPALSAFLRGIERRAFVFAEVQCGDPARAEAALAQAMQAFRPLSAEIPLAGWPAAFWAVLLAQPDLSDGRSAEPELVHLGTGPRAALLLRLVGGLDFAHAAEVMGVSESTYRFALQRALRQMGDAGLSFAALAALRERLHRRVKALPEPRVAGLAALRQRALSGLPEPRDEAPVVAGGTSRVLLWLLFGLLLAALAATWWPGLALLKGPPPADPFAAAALPEEAAPPAPAQGDTDVVTHPDYAQLSAPADDALATDLALLAWFAAGGADEVPDAPADDGEAADAP